LNHAEEMRNGVYEDYSKARFAFGEAIELWPENSRARKGLAQATRSYAESALARGDYALGLSLLDENDADTADLHKELKTAKRRQARNRTVAFWSGIAAVSFLILGIGVSSILYYDARIARNDAVDQKK